MSEFITVVLTILTRGGVLLAAAYFTIHGRYDVASLALLSYIALVVEDMAKIQREERTLRRIGGPR